MPIDKVKIDIPVNKGNWPVSPLPGPIVLITTVDQRGIPNVAVKSWISMMAMEVVAFGCNMAHHTAQNVLATGEFVINFPGAELIDKTWATSEFRQPSPTEIEKCGFTPIPALKVRPPRLVECKAHLECQLDFVREYGQEVALFGRIVAASIDEAALQGSAVERYTYLAPTFYLESGVYGTLEAVMRRKGDLGE